MKFRQCSKCKEQKEEKYFSRTARSTRGHWYRNSQCNHCRTKYHRDKYHGGRTNELAKVTEAERECMHCRNMFLKENTRGSYCKEYWKKRFYNRERAGIHTKKYRERHKERWRALHRITQFNRKSLIKITNDGTVTDQFIKEVLNRAICMWCNTKIPKDIRTIEHIIELSNGGLHSATNIGMACLSCNSSRKNKGALYDLG